VSLGPINAVPVYRIAMGGTRRGGAHLLSLVQIVLRTFS
jgi:hypothetical protein